MWISDNWVFLGGVQTYFELEFKGKTLLVCAKGVLFCAMRDLNITCSAHFFDIIFNWSNLSQKLFKSLA